MIKWLGNWDDFIRFRFSLQPQNPGWRTGAGTAAASGSTGKLRKRLHPGYNMETRLNIPQFPLQNHQKINTLAITHPDLKDIKIYILFSCQTKNNWLSK